MKLKHEFIKFYYLAIKIVQWWMEDVEMDPVEDTPRNVNDMKMIGPNTPRVEVVGAKSISREYPPYKGRITNFLD